MILSIYKYNIQTNSKCSTYFFCICPHPCIGHSPNYNNIHRPEYPLILISIPPLSLFAKICLHQTHYNQKTSPFLRTSLLPFTLLDSYFQLSNIFILGTYGIYFNCSSIQMNSRHSPSLLPVLVKNKIYPTNPCKASLRITVTSLCPHGSHYFYKFQELCFLEHSRIYSRSNFSKVDNSCHLAKVQPPLPSHSFLFP